MIDVIPEYFHVHLHPLEYQCDVCQFTLQQFQVFSSEDIF